MGNCSPPPIPKLKEALDKWVPDICQYHDAAWMTRKWSDKWKADCMATRDLLVRGVVLTMCGLLAPLWFVPLGTLFWMWKKYKPRSNRHEQEG